MNSPHKRLLRGPDNSFLLTTKPFSRTGRQTVQFELSLKGIEPPFSSRIDEELDYLCKSFGFLEPLQVQNSAEKVFKELAKTKQLLSSSQLSRTLGISRGAIINQLNNLQRSGLVAKRGRLYALRSNSMLHTIEELESDVERVFEKTKKAAKQIDKEFGIDE